MNKTKKGLLFVLSLVVPLSVAAQEDAGRIGQRFEKPIEPKSTLQPLTLPIDEKVPPENADKLHFFLKEIVIKGNTVFTSEELAPLYSGLIGRQITLLDIFKVRDVITAKYGNAGYGLTKALIPQQILSKALIQSDNVQPEAAIVHIDIIEGFIDEVVIEGGTDEQKYYLGYAIKKLKAERPLRVKTLERYLLLANDRFAIKVTSTMKPSDKTPAASTLILKVEPASKLEGVASFDNRGTPAVGPNQLSANLAVNGLGGRANQTALSYATTAQSGELQYISLTHTKVLTAEGTALSIGWIKSTSHPGTPTLLLLGSQSDSETWSLKLAQPYIRTRQENLSTYVKYDQQNLNGKSLSVLTLEDKIRSFRFGLNYDKADAYNGINQALVEYSFDLSGMGASDYNNPLRACEFFKIYTATGAHNNWTRIKTA